MLVGLKEAYKHQTMVTTVWLKLTDKFNITLCSLKLNCDSLYVWAGPADNQCVTCILNHSSVRLLIWFWFHGLTALWRILLLLKVSYPSKYQHSTLVTLCCPWSDKLHFHQGFSVEYWLQFNYAYIFIRLQSCLQL